MKYFTLILSLILAGQIFAQPDQQLIPNYVLTGKSSDELRLLRNEIFARHGYIFKTEELKNHFSTKKWYKPEFENINSKLSEIDKENINRILEYEKAIKENKYENLYSNYTEASISKFKDRSDGTLITKTREVSFHRNYKIGRIKKVVESTDYGGEGLPTVIYAETVDPSMPYWSTTKYFNELIFDTDYYKAIEYGCCDAETYYEFYNYKTEIPFFKTNEKYFLIEIPNTEIDLFIGYNHEISNKDDNIIANLNLSTVYGLINSITFKTKNRKDTEDIITYFTPNIELIVSDLDDVRGNRVTLWSMNFKKDIRKITGFSLIINFIGENTGRKASIVIPIDKGFLNGNSENQTMIVELK